MSKFRSFLATTDRTHFFVFAVYFLLGINYFHFVVGPLEILVGSFFFFARFFVGIVFLDLIPQI